MGTGDSTGFRKGLPKVKGSKNFLPAPVDGKKCSKPKNLRQFKSWRTCETTPDQESSKRPVSAGVRMSQFLRKPEAILWVVSISQAAAMLAFNVLLRAAVL